MVFDLQIHGNTNFYSFFILLCHGAQVVQEPFIKQDVAKSSSIHLVMYDNWIKTVYFISWYTSVATNLTEIVLFELGLFGIWWKKYFFFKVNYLSSSKAQVSTFAILSWHWQEA